MILLNSFLCDVLNPKENREKSYYNDFIGQYTLITVSSVVSQKTFIPETYDGLSSEQLNSDIEDMIGSMPEMAEKRRKTYRATCKGNHIEPGNILQESEDRSFVSNFFIEESNRYGMSSRELIIHSLHRSSFMNYFTLIEDTLKCLYVQICDIDDKTQIAGSKVITVCLDGILKKLEIKSEFTSELIRRSKFFLNFKSLERVWSLLNFIRNRSVHYNCYYDESAINELNKKIELVCKLWDGRKDKILEINMFLQPFNNLIKSVRENEYMLFNNELENIIRNISVFVMESIYECDNKRLGAIG